MLIPALAIAAAADKEVAHSFRVTIASQSDMEIQGQRQKLDGDTELHYTWRRGVRERALSFDTLTVKLKVDGKELMNTSMSRAKVVNIRQAEKDEVLLENAPEQAKKILQDSFGAPVCKLQVDESGNEVKREVVAGPGAKALIDQGMIANALLFHPTFPVGKDEWEADREIPMGNGGYAKGKVTYTKRAATRCRPLRCRARSPMTSSSSPACSRALRGPATSSAASRLTTLPSRSGFRES